MPTRNRPSRRHTARTRSPRRTATRSAARRPDALRLLKEDHARVKGLFAKFERARGESAKQELAERICEELKLHATMEEEVFYPRARESVDDEEIMHEADVEHGSAKDLIRQIEGCSASDPRYDALVKVLAEYVQHHVKEEEGEMFRQIRRSDLDLASLGEQMKQWKSGHEGRSRGRLASMLGG